MLAENSARIFSRGARFRAEAAWTGSNMDGKFVLGNGFFAIKMVEFDFGCRCKPKVGVLDFEEIGGEFRQLPCAHERRSVDQKWWENFRVAVLARVHVQEKVCKRALQPRAPASVNGKSRAGNLGSCGQIENARALADFPVRLRLKIKFLRFTPAPHFCVVGSARANRNRRMRNVRNSQQEIALRSVEFRDALVGLLD